MSKTILVPVDGSSHSKKALEFAVELATKLDGRLCLLYVLETPSFDRALVLGASAITVRDAEAELGETGEKVIAAARQIAVDGGCGNVDARAVAGDPAAEILKRAKAVEADLIVMGSRGLSDLEGLLLGSVSHKVNHLASCTCVTVR